MRNKLSKQEERTARLCALRSKAEKMTPDHLRRISGVDARTVYNFLSGKPVSVTTEKALIVALKVRRGEAVYVAPRDFSDDPCAALEAGELAAAYDGLGVLSKRDGSEFGPADERLVATLPGHRPEGFCPWCQRCHLGLPCDLEQLMF